MMKNKLYKYDENNLKAHTKAQRTGKKTNHIRICYHIRKTEK